MFRNFSSYEQIPCLLKARNLKRRCKLTVQCCLVTLSLSLNVISRMDLHIRIPGLCHKILFTITWLFNCINLCSCIRQNTNSSLDYAFGILVI